MTRFLLGMALATSAWAINPACKPADDATVKTYSVPVHIYSTETAGYMKGKTEESELIYLNNKTYVRVHGQWRVSPATPQKMLEIRKDAERQDANYTCRAVRDEPVNGEAATLYSIHHKTEDATTDTQIWVSKSRTLVLKMEIDMDVGGAGKGKSHRSARYDYSNVQAPSGAH